MEEEEVTITEAVCEDVIIDTSREAYCAGLEALAKWLRDNTNARLPENTEFIRYTWQKDDFVEQVKALGGRSEKKYSEYYATVQKTFGPLCYGIRTSRESVCERKVVGKKIVAGTEAYIVPAQPAQEIDVVEWECSSILAPSDDTEK